MSDSYFCRPIWWGFHSSVWLRRIWRTPHIRKMGEVYCAQAGPVVLMWDDIKRPRSKWAGDVPRGNRAWIDAVYSWTFRMVVVGWRLNTARHKEYP